MLMFIEKIYFNASDGESNSLSNNLTLEVYLNIIEWGNGIFGCEHASLKYYKHSSATLSPVESALMASVLPSPRNWSVLDPQPHVSDRQSKILSIMSQSHIPIQY